MRNGLLLLASLTAAILAGACGTTTSPAPRVVRIALNHDSVALRVADTTSFSAMLIGETGTVVDGTVAWHSSDAQVASVSQAGVVTAHAPGMTTITARTGTASASGIAYVALGGTYTLRRVNGEPVPGTLATWQPDCSRYPGTVPRYTVYGGHLRFDAARIGDVESVLDVLEECAGGGGSSSRYYGGASVWSYQVTGATVRFLSGTPAAVYVGNAGRAGDTLTVRWKPDLSDSLTLQYVR